MGGHGQRAAIKLLIRHLVLFRAASDAGGLWSDATDDPIVGPEAPWEAARHDGET